MGYNVPTTATAIPMSDSFAKAQARHDCSEHPDFYVDDRAEAFAEAIQEECAKQLAQCHEMLAGFIADRIRGNMIDVLRRDPVEFARECVEIIATESEKFIPTLVQESMAFADRRSSESLRVDEIVRMTLRTYTEPFGSSVQVCTGGAK